MFFISRMENPLDYGMEVTARIRRLQKFPNFLNPKNGGGETHQNDDVR